MVQWFCFPPHMSLVKLSWSPQTENHRKDMRMGGKLLEGEGVFWFALCRCEHSNQE